MDRVRGAAACDDELGPAGRNACIKGGGYSLLPDFLVARDIEEGRLVCLLPTYKPAEQPIFAYYAQ